MPLSQDDVACALIAQKWTFARTAPQNPHWYTVRKQWVGSVPFDDLVMHIRENGYKLPFKGRDYICFDIGEHRFWTMGSPLSNTWIINRAVNGQQ